MSNNFKKLEKAQKDVLKAQKQFRRIEGRNEYLKGLGYEIDVKPMGAGGVGQIKKYDSLKQYRVQTSYGTGNYNYASCIIIKF